MCISIYNPTSLALDRLLSKPPHKLQRYVEHARLLLHFICTKQWTGQVDKIGFARLHSDILRHYIHGSMLAPLIRWLVDAGVIETAPHSRGHFSKGYRITPGFDGPARRILLTNTALCRKLRAYRDGCASSGNPPPPEVLDRRADILAAMRRSLAGLGFVCPVDEAIARAIRQGVQPAHAEYACRAIMDGVHDGGGFDSFGYRAHSIVTRTSSKIRGLLTLNGEPLVELDVANCQPLLLAAALQDPQIWTTYIDLRAISRGGQHNGREGPPPAPPSTLLDTVDTQELRRFTGFCERAELYDYLESSGGFPDKETTKKRFFSRLYGRPGGRPSIMARILAAEWPTCWAAIDAVKRAYHYKATSQVLQRLESAVMIDGVCGRLVREVPDVCFLTVHDSLLVHAEHVGTVRRTMAAEFDKVGVHVEISEKQGELCLTPSHVVRRLPA